MRRRLCRMATQSNSASMQRTRKTASVRAQGTITRFDVPGGPGVRVEAYVQAGSVISPFYDSMVAKLIVWGRDRDEALARGRRALSEFNIEGIATTIPFHQAVLENEIFQRGEAHTDFIEVTGL